MRLILIMFSTFIALSIMAGCIEEKNGQTDVYFDVANVTEDDAPLSIEKQSLPAKQKITSDEHAKGHKPPSRRKKQSSSVSEKPLRRFTSFSELPLRPLVREAGLRLHSLVDKSRSTVDAVGLSRTEYQVIVENNLFRPIGWRKEVVKKTRPKTETVVLEIPKERPAPTYTLTLTGIAQNGSEWIAILEDRTRKEGYFLHRGEKLKDSLVSEILSEHIILVQGDSKTQFPLGESIQYNTNGQLLLNTIANQSTHPRPSEENSSVALSEKDKGTQKSLIERMRARRRKELGQE